MKKLPVGIPAKIVSYATHNTFTERLRELGLVEGTWFKIVRKAPFNGPIELQYGHSQLVLRADETSFIHVEAI